MLKTDEKYLTDQKQLFSLNYYSNDTDDDAGDADATGGFGTPSHRSSKTKEFICSMSMLMGTLQGYLDLVRK